MATGSFRLARPARDRYAFDDDLITERGRIAVAEFEAAQQVAHTMNLIRDTARFPEMAVRAGDLQGAGLLQEVAQLVVEAFRRQQGKGVFADALAYVATEVGAEPIEGTMLRFVADFPPPPVYRGDDRPETYLPPHRDVSLEELMLLWLSNQNPAFVRFRELFHDQRLKESTAYEPAIDALDQFFGDRPGLGEGGESLLAQLMAPALASPTSIEGQLDYVRANWSDLLGTDFAPLVDRILRTIDVLREERKHGGLGFGPPPIPDARALAGGSRTGIEEYERFSVDSSWMPRVVMLAKSTYVWLDQLARAYQREINRLDQVPDEELDRIAESGFTALWLIGVWERSEASRRIKQMRGDHEAVASAYALHDYEIAVDLGGANAYANLRDRAGARGVRLASDMVPNHVGIDGRWVIEHPHWFLGLDEPPYPGYSFTGEDLSDDPRVSIQIEDHYWDGTDAAVVFRRHDRESGATRYLYHGNDGTAMPWNDTAQLDYLSAEVREGVIKTILHVARMFPIIRFDAAMTLAKRHVQRLWFPEPGAGGAIPSRAQHGMTAAEFDAALPEEFWREVVDRVAAEVPDTLLLAEAFWLMEGYFVRTLGMHRVYNSAFMHMTAAENNGGYRQLMRNVLEFDPEVLKRFVNFMSNPDEETAIAQFGKDDKYFGVATVLATMPGLPMFGHGQVEGYTEKYGMEFRYPKWQEDPDQWLVDRHRREIFPLLHRRRQFAEVGEFLLYDVGNDDVYAYSNRVDGDASLVLFHNRYAQAQGTVHGSVPYRDKGAGAMRTRRLAEGLGLGTGDWTILREHRSGLEYLRRSSEIAAHGLPFTLEAFECRVYLDIREVSGEDYDTLAERLAGGGVRSVEEALADLRLEPVHREIAEAIRAAPLPRSVTPKPLRDGLPPPPWWRELLRAARVLAPLDAARLGRAAEWGGLDPHVAAALESLLSRDELPVRRPDILALLAEPEVAELIGAHEADGVWWFAREAYRVFAAALVAVARARGASPQRGGAMARMLAASEERSEYRYVDLIGG